MRLRPALTTDVEVVHALLVEREIAEFGAADTALEDVRDAWRGSGFDLRADTCVVEVADARIVGYAVRTRAGTTVVVARGEEGRGIGTRLRHWAERRDRDLGRDRHCQSIAVGNERARALLLSAGYRPGRGYLRLARRLESVDPTTPLPPGVSLRAVAVERDAAAVHALAEASFKDNADYSSYSPAAFSEAHLEAHDFDPALSCVAECGGEMIGLLLAWWWREGNVGFVDLLGTRPDHRGRGLGTAMLQTAFARFAAVGIPEAQLGVATDNVNALRLYERCGMTERFRHDTYERPVAEPRLERTSESLQERSDQNT